jgi:hypothetical protein
MRIWSLHPSYLDTKGLLAAWREGLLAQSVINKPGAAYSNHPQLNRFKHLENYREAIGYYLAELHRESVSRYFKFNREKINCVSYDIKIPVTSGQVLYEFNHLRNKLKSRDPEKYKTMTDETGIKLNPLFNLVEGPVEDWEKVK